MRALALGLLLGLPALAPADTRFSPEEAGILQSGLIATADEFILPGYQAQAEAAAALTSALESYCANTAEIGPVHEAFAGTFLAWQRVSVIGTGPIMAAEGPMRVQLWPDPKGFAQRAIRSAIRAEDPALLAPDGLAGRSVALVNLTALEDLLYGAMAPETYACDLATAIAAFQAALAAEIVIAWTPGSPFRTDFDAAAAGNATYASVDALIRVLLSGAVVYADRLRKFKILRGLGAAPGEARPERTEAAQSGLGLESIAVGFRALSELYQTPNGLFDIAPDLGGSMEYYLLGETAASVADSLSVQTATLTEIAAEDGPRAAEIRRYGELVLFHEDFLKVEFPGSLGLTAGFTAADGD
ncbi:MAG: imelysin family protein [Pikeienuella sp.]